MPLLVADCWSVLQSEFYKLQTYICISASTW